MENLIELKNEELSEITGGGKFWDFVKGAAVGIGIAFFVGFAMAGAGYKF